MTRDEIILSNAPFLDMGEASNFGNEAANMADRVVSITIENNTTSQHIVSLTPSYFAENDVQLSTGTLKDLAGVAIEGLTAQSNGNVSIEQFLAEIMHFPTRVLRTQFESDNKSQLSVQLTLQGKSMYGNPAPRRIGLGSFKSTGANDRELIIANSQYQLEPTTEIMIPIKARKAAGTPTILTIIFYCGASFDMDLALDRVAKIALSDPETAALAQSYLG